MSKTANDRQVGGSHYKRKAGYDHWDWVIDTHQGYLEACTTKYLSRWWLKGGIPDIEKAIHYLDKAIETCDKTLFMRKTAILYSVPAADWTHTTWLEVAHGHTQRFAQAYELNVHEHVIMAIIAGWYSRADLKHARELLDDYLKVVKAVNGQRIGVPASEQERAELISMVNFMSRLPVPLEDSNKHADRAAPAVDPGDIGFGSEMKR